MKQKKKKHPIRLVLIGLLALFIIAAAIPFTRSLMVMKAFSTYEQQHSLLHDKDITLKIPGGGSWYPFVMTFSDDEGFSSWIGEEARLTILYNFPEYTSAFGCSGLFDPDSEYYNSFYGAYVVALEDGSAYGFNEDGTIDADEIAKVPQFDFWYLVLYDFGLTKEDRVFDWNLEDVTEDVTYLGSDGWTEIEAELTVNGCYHQKDGFVTSYLQYGSPKTIAEEEAFEPVTMQGRIYGKYIPEKQVSIFFYCLGMDDTVVEETDADLLQQSTLRY